MRVLYAVGSQTMHVTLLTLVSVLSVSGCVSEDEQAAARRAMVAEQLAKRDITSPEVLAAMERVPRHLFVPAPARALAYADHPLPIGNGQTISQPYVVALMTQLAELEADDVVLEIGTGSGYQAAVLAEIVRTVYTIEIVAELADSARARLRAEGYANVVSRQGDGYAGWEQHAPFDAILVTAAPDHVPEALVRQLAPGGILVIPVGPRGAIQSLRKIRKPPDGGEPTDEEVIPVRFVPLVRQSR